MSDIREAFEELEKIDEALTYLAEKPVHMRRPQIAAIKAALQSVEGERSGAQQGEVTVNSMADVLLEAWKKAEPDHAITANPVSYLSTFADMARAALSVTAPRPVNLMFSSGHKAPFSFTAGDRRFALVTEANETGLPFPEGAVDVTGKPLPTQVPEGRYKLVPYNVGLSADTCFLIVDSETGEKLYQGQSSFSSMSREHGERIVSALNNQPLTAAPSGDAKREADVEAQALEARAAQLTEASLMMDSEHRAYLMEAADFLEAEAARLRQSDSDGGE